MRYKTPFRRAVCVSLATELNTQSIRKHRKIEIKRACTAYLNTFLHTPKFFSDATNIWQSRFKTHAMQLLTTSQLLIHRFCMKILFIFDGVYFIEGNCQRKIQLLSKHEQLFLCTAKYEQCAVHGSLAERKEFLYGSFLRFLKRSKYRNNKLGFIRNNFECECNLNSN